MSQPLLEVRNATKIYRGGFLQPGQQLVALQDFNLTIPEEPATITAIAGESGSGKTTLANLILGFIGPTSGQILYRGQDIVDNEHAARSWSTRARSRPFFRIHTRSTTRSTGSSTFLTSSSRTSSSPATKSAARDLIEEALKMVGMRGEEVLEKYPHQLSGGQRQRMMVARAYLLSPV